MKSNFSESAPIDLSPNYHFDHQGLGQVHTFRYKWQKIGRAILMLNDHDPWNCKLNTKFRLEFQVEYKSWGWIVYPFWECLYMSSKCFFFLFFLEKCFLFLKTCQSKIREDKRCRLVKHKFYVWFHFSDGYRKFQLKLGGDPDEDIARFRLIREALDKECVIVGDANTGTPVAVSCG